MQSLYEARLALAKAEYEALVAKRIEELNMHQAEFKRCADAANAFIDNKSLPRFDAISHDKFMHDLQHIKDICKKSRYWKFVDNKASNCDAVHLQHLLRLGNGFVDRRHECRRPCRSLFCAVC